MLVFPNARLETAHFSTMLCTKAELQNKYEGTFDTVFPSAQIIYD